MARIKINDKYVINGVLEVRRYMDEENNVIVEGSFSCHYYFEEINSLESMRYKVEGIEVREELFNSEDFNIVYNFTAKKIDNVYGASCLSADNIRSIEKDIYGESGYVLNTLLDKHYEENNEGDEEDDE